MSEKISENQKILDSWPKASMRPILYWPLPKYITAGSSYLQKKSFFFSFSWIFCHSNCPTPQQTFDFNHLHEKISFHFNSTLTWNSTILSAGGGVDPFYCSLYLASSFFWFHLNNILKKWHLLQLLRQHGALQHSIRNHIFQTRVKCRMTVISNTPYGWILSDETI